MDTTAALKAAKDGGVALGNPRLAEVRRGHPPRSFLIASLMRFEPVTDGVHRVRVTLVRLTALKSPGPRGSAGAAQGKLASDRLPGPWR